MQPMRPPAHGWLLKEETMPITKKQVMTIEYGHQCKGQSKPNPNITFSKQTYRWRFFSKPVNHCPDCGEKLEIPDRPERKREKKKQT